LAGVGDLDLLGVAGLELDWFEVATGLKGEVVLELRRWRSQVWSPWFSVSWISLGLSQRASAGVVWWLAKMRWRDQVAALRWSMT